MVKKSICIKFLLLWVFAICLSCSGNKKKAIANDDEIVNFVFVSDQHYGLERELNNQILTSEYVNLAMLNAINSLPSVILPNDGGVGSNTKIEGIEMIINGGDISNRMQPNVQSAAESWKQFQQNFIEKIETRQKNGALTELFLIPGNHDVSNAIGYTSPLNPATDKTVMAEIYNLMIKPKTKVSAEDYDYTSDKIHYVIDRFGIRFMMINIWPSAEERLWMDSVMVETPVIIFGHDELDVELKHLTNPAKGNPIGDGYENIISDINIEPGTSVQEQRNMAQWIARNPSVKAYFHGNTNYNEFYVYQGPDQNIALNTFRVDSPMKGEYSAFDSSLLSFQVISININKMEMSVRECFWARGKDVEWGEVKTISL